MLYTLGLHLDYARAWVNFPYWCSLKCLWPKYQEPSLKVCLSLLNPSNLPQSVKSNGEQLSYYCLTKNNAVLEGLMSVISHHLPLIAMQVGKVHYGCRKMMSGPRLNNFPLQINKTIYNSTLFLHIETNANFNYK